MVAQKTHAHKYPMQNISPEPIFPSKDFSVSLLNSTAKIIESKFSVFFLEKHKHNS